jgi:hypothetical protein
MFILEKLIQPCLLLVLFFDVWNDVEGGRIMTIIGGILLGFKLLLNIGTFGCGESIRKKIVFQGATKSQGCLIKFSNVIKKVERPLSLLVTIMEVLFMVLISVSYLDYRYPMSLLSAAFGLRMLIDFAIFVELCGKYWSLEKPTTDQGIQIKELIRYFRKAYGWLLLFNLAKFLFFMITTLITYKILELDWKFMFFPYACSSLFEILFTNILTENTSKSEKQFGGEPKDPRIKFFFLFLVTVLKFVDINLMFWFCSSYKNNSSRGLIYINSGFCVVYCFVLIVSKSNLIGFSSKKKQIGNYTVIETVNNDEQD